MKNLIIFSILSLLNIYHVNAQDSLKTSKPIRKMKITDVFVTTGFLTEKGATGTLSDFQTLAPNSVLLSNDFTGYSFGNGFSINTNTMVSFNLGIRFSDKEKTKYNFNPLLKIGITYLSPNSLGTYYYKDEITRGDTLSSSSSGQVLYVDTINTKNYWMSYGSDQLRLDVSVLFRTNEMARWSLYTGMGFTAGMSINSKTYISYGDYTKTNLYNPSTNTDINEGVIAFSGNTEIAGNKSNICASIFLPMGVDFRIGKSNPFWKQIHLFYDIRPGLNITSIPELRTYANVSIQHGLGFRYSW